MMMRSTEVAEFPDVECIRETAKAIMVRLDTGKEHWVPKSVIDDDSEVYGDGTQGTLIVKEWWAVKEGLE